MAAFRSNPMYGASGLAFELPETSADEDAAPAAPPSTARLSSATGSLRRLSSNSFDFANAPKRGDPKRAYAASLMRRCIKKTVVDQTRSPSIAPLFLDPTGLRVRVERFSSVGVPLKRLHEFGCPIAVTLYLDFLLEGFCMFMLLGMLSLPLMFDSTMRNHRRQECRVLHTAEIAAAAAPAVLAVNSTPATPPRAALDPGCGYNTIGVRASLPSSSNSPWRTLLLPAIGTCMDYADTTIRETANVSASERDAIISAAANLTTTQVIQTRGYDPFVNLDEGADYCIDGTSGLFGGGSGILLVWSLTICALVFGLYLLRTRRMQVNHETIFHKEALTAADFAVSIVGLEQIGYNDENGMPELEVRLRTDLNRLGFADEDIDHIEIGRDCRRELVQLTKLASLRARREELRFQLALLHERQATMTRWYDARSDQRKYAVHRLKSEQKQAKEVEAAHEALSKVNADQLAARNELRRLRSEAHTTTGHAFIVFQTIRDRDRFLNLFNKAAKALGEGGLMELLRVPLKWVQRKKQRVGSELLQAAGWKEEGVRVRRAPEPNDIYWENLELQPKERRNRKRLSILLILVLLLLGTVLLYVARSWQIGYFQHLSTLCDTQSTLFCLSDADVSSWRTLAGFAIVGVSAGVTLLVNQVLKAVTVWLTYREGHPTRSSYEKSSFTKLILAYTLNTVLAPILVSVLTLYDPMSKTLTFFIGRFITQAWYESGGVVSQAIILIVCNAIITDFLRATQIDRLFNRYVRGRFAASQIKLNQLYAPPPMAFGHLYAETFRTLSIGVVYAPIYPPAFILTALALLLSFYATKFAIAHWYMRPPLVDGQLMKRFRNACSFLLFACYIAASIFGVRALQSNPSADRQHIVAHAVTALVVAVLLWICTLSPLYSRMKYFSTRFKEDFFTSAASGGVAEQSESSRNSSGHRNASPEDPRLKGKGIERFVTLSDIRYEEVTERLGYLLERYECPAASRMKSTKHLEDTAFRQGFTGGFVDAGTANVIEPDEGPEGSGAEGDDEEDGNVEPNRQVSPPRRSIWSIGASKNTANIYNGSFFQPVAKPVPLKEDVKEEAPPPAPLVKADSGKGVMSKKERGASSRRSMTLDASSKPTSTAAVAQAPPRSFSKDPVIFHLDGALEAINTILTDMGGSHIIESTDVSELSRRVVDTSDAAASSERAEVARPRARSLCEPQQQRMSARSAFSLARSVTSRFGSR